MKRRWSESQGAIVKGRREAAGMSQDALAKLVGVQPAQISRLEAGIKGPSFETLMAISKALDIDLNLLRPVEEDELALEDAPTVT